MVISHDGVIKWNYFPCNWPFVRGIHRSPVNSPHKGQWRRALMFSLICVWINREVGDLRRYRAHYDLIVMQNSPCWEFGLYRGCMQRQLSTWHYSDVIMSTMASQIAGVSIVYSTVCLGAYQRKHQTFASLALTGEFPPQRSSNAENVCIWWRHHE